MALLQELNTSVRRVNEFNIAVSHCCCKRDVKKRERDSEGASEKTNSIVIVRGRANDWSAETRPARFRERWCHPVSTYEKQTCKRQKKTGDVPIELYSTGTQIYVDIKTRHENRV